MKHDEAKQLASKLNKQSDGITYRPERQYWREGNFWYVAGSDKSGHFNPSPQKNQSPT